MSAEARSGDGAARLSGAVVLVRARRQVVGLHPVTEELPDRVGCGVAGSEVCRIEMFDRGGELLRCDIGQEVVGRIDRSADEAEDEIRAAAIGAFREKEGTTYILNKENADALQLDYNFEAASITLNVYSSLQDIGLTAAVSTVLANNNIPCNCIAGYYHDHLFVPEEQAQKALSLLQSL